MSSVAALSRPRVPASAVPRSVYWLLAAVHVVCPLLFFTDLTRNPYFTQISLLHGGLCLAVALFVIHALRRGGTAVAFTPLDVPLLIFTAVMLLSLLLSWGAHPALRPSIWNEGSRVTHFWVVNGLLAYWIAVQTEEAPWGRRFRWILYAVGAVAAGYGILQYLGVEFVWSTTLNPYSGRPVSTFGNPNFLSSYLVLLLPLAAADGVHARTPRLSFLMAAVFLLFTSAIICTMTRSSWIGAAAALAVFAWFGRRWVRERRRWAAGVAAGAALIVLFWPSSPLAEKATRPVDRMTELITGITREKSYGSWHQRLMIWSCAWDMVNDRPWLGKGWGCFELFYPFYQGGYMADEVFRRFRTHANNAHNVLLEFWSQIGGAGTALFFWLCLLFFELARRRIPLLPEEDRLTAWALLAGLAGMMADNFFGNVSLFFAVPAFLFWWLAGSLARRVSPEPPRWIAVRGPFAWAAGAGIVLLCAAGVARAYRHWQAEVLYFDGFKKAKQGDVRGAIAATEESHDHRRWEVNNNYELGNAYARQARWSADQGLDQEARRMLDKSLWAYDEAIAANAGYDEIYFNRGTVLSQLDRTGDAVLSYRTALLINPLSMEAYKALGNVYLTREGSLPAAADHFERAVFYFPRDKDLWNNLGYVYSRLDRKEEAVEAYVRALSVDFRFPTAWKNFRVALNALGRKEHPLLAVPELWTRLGRHMEAARWREARPVAEQLAALLTENEEVRWVLGDICLNLGDTESARRSYEQVLAWSPQNAEARKGLARLHQAQGNRSAALEILRPLAEERPDDKDAAELLRRLESGLP